MCFFFFFFSSLFGLVLPFTNARHFPVHVDSTHAALCWKHCYRFFPMDLGRILDGPPEQPPLAQPMDFFTTGAYAPTPNTGLDYCLPVSMTEFQRQLNDEVVSLHYSDILKFYEKDADTADNQVLASSLQALYTNSQLVGTHPYLLVDHYLPPNLLLKDIPNRLSKASGKFTALVNIIELVRTKKMEIALISRPGKSFDLIEALLLGKMINYKRHSGSYLRATNKLNKKYSTVHLIPSSQLDSTYNGNERFDLMIALDQTFNPSDPHIASIRSQARTTPIDINGTAPSLAPIIRLLPYYSAEHVALKFQNYSHDKTTFMRHVIAPIAILRGRVGTIPVDLKPYYAQGLHFLEPWLGDMQSAWPLPLAPDIEVYSAEDVEKSLLSEVIVATKQESDTPDGSNVNGSSKNASSETHNSTVVETKSEDDEYYRAKRIKREKFSPETFEVKPKSALSSFNRSLEDRQVLTHKILRRLEIALRDLEFKDSEIMSLRSDASFKQAAYEETVDEMSDFVNQISVLKEKIRISERKSERHDTEMKRMREQIEKQTMELEEVHNLLLAKKEQDLKEEDKPQDAGKTINFADVETQRVKITELEEELKKCKDNIETRTRENDYMRVEYQKASSSATELAEEVQAIKTQNGLLTAKLASNIGTMKQRYFDEERKAKDAHITVLSAKLVNVEEHLKRVLENEKQQNMRSRYGMRSSSSAPRRTKSPSVNSSRRSSPSDREGNVGAGNGSSGPHPLQNMTNSF